MPSWWRLLVGRGLGIVSDEVELAIGRLIPSFRRLMTGLLGAVVVLALWLAGLIFILAALFLYLSGNDGLALPAVWTGLMSWLMAGLGMIVVSRSFRWR